ncbi:Uncharacterised protein [Vibrio cholerae]|nr:Uncharacterised protein [Vibrio cholerae]
MVMVHKHQPVMRPSATTNSLIVTVLTWPCLRISPWQYWAVHSNVESVSLPV